MLPEREFPVPRKGVMLRWIRQAQSEHYYESHISVSRTKPTIKRHVWTCGSSTVEGYTCFQGKIYSVRRVSDRVWETVAVIADV